MTNKRISEIIKEEIDALDFFQGLNNRGNDLTPWDSEGKMDRMQPSNAARSKGNMPPREYIPRGYNDWKENYSHVMDYAQYRKRFGLSR